MIEIESLTTNQNARVTLFLLDEYDWNKIVKNQSKCKSVAGWVGLYELTPTLKPNPYFYNTNPNPNPRILEPSNPNPRTLT